MPTQKITCKSLLNEFFKQRKKRNASYSLRAFARDMGVSPVYASYLLKGERKPSVKKAYEIAQNLSFTDLQRRSFLTAVSNEAGFSFKWNADFEENTDLLLEDPSEMSADLFYYYHDWYHLALLDLTFIKAFRPNVNWISNQLGIPSETVRVAAERLLRLGLLKIDGNRWYKINRDITIKTSESIEAIREHHRQMMDLAKHAMNRVGKKEFENREIVGTTLAIDGTKIQEARRRIQKFRRSMLRFLTDGESTELYQLNLQFFRLTKSPLSV